MMDTQKTARHTVAADRAAAEFSDEEKAAMKERARELKTAGRRRASAARADEADGEGQLLAKVAEMDEPDRVMAERLHAIIKAAAPDLSPGLWYGMPAYSRGGNLICHFQDRRKFRMRYATLGFSDKAKFDDGAIWPVAYALTELTPEAEAKIVALVKKAAS
jgi:hypothetical protein